MKNRLFKKFYCVTTFIVVLSLAILMVILCLFVSNYLAKEKQGLLADNCKTIANVATSVSSEYDFENSLSHMIEISSKSINADIYVTDRKGKVLTCSCTEWKKDGSCIHSRSKISKKILDAAIEGKFFEVGDFGNMFKEAHYTYGTDIKNSSGQVIAAVFATSPASSLTEFVSEIVKMFLVSSLVPIGLLFISLYITTFRFTKPLKMMSEAASLMAKGDFSMRIPTNKIDDEINELAKSFNKMTDSLVQLEGMRRSFVANVSHELKTPMTTISGFIDGIIDGTIPEDKKDYYLDIVSKEVRRLSRLVQSMFSLAKLESGELKPSCSQINLGEIICTSVISLEQKIENKGLDIEGLEKVEGLEAYADPDLIHQVVYNLVDNAVKFSNENGKISFGAFEKDNTVSFVIRNSGQGISKEDMPYIFDRFYKVDKSRSVYKDSTGLGLYLVKTIVDLHGGKITVRSVYGKYTEFEVYLNKIPNSKIQLGEAK